MSEENMPDEIQNIEHNKPKVFMRRLDFYWQFIVVYFIALIVYALMRGSISDGAITFVFYDPVVLLMFIFILITSGSLFFQLLKKRSIIIGEDFIIFKSRRREMKYSLDNIKRISLSKERRIRVKKTIRVIKITLNNRRFPIKLNPSSYLNDKTLAQEIMRIKQKIKSLKTKSQNA